MSKQNPAVWNKRPASHPRKKGGEMGILQKAAEKTSYFLMFCLTSKIHQIIMNLNEEKSAPKIERFTRKL